jgi:Trp operon repressor
MLFTQASKKGDIESFLKDMFTPSEIYDFYQRIEIIKSLLSGKAQRRISKSLNVSITKVTRGAQALRSSKGGFKKVLKRA